MREGLEGKIMLVVNPQAPEALKSLTCYQISAGRYLALLPAEVPESNEVLCELKDQPNKKGKL